MKLSQVVFRVTFVVLVCTYIAFILEFLNVNSLSVDFNVRPDAIVLTLLVVAFVFIFFRRSR